MFPIEKYKFIVLEDSKKVIALSTYGDKTVRGVAVCSDTDTFDVQKGKELAAARCALKVAQKRLKRANDEYKFSTEIREIWTKQIEKNVKFMNDASTQFEEAVDHLHSLLLTM